MAEQKGDPSGNRPRANHDHGRRLTHSDVQDAHSRNDEGDKNADSDDDTSADQE